MFYMDICVFVCVVYAYHLDTNTANMGGNRVGGKERD